MISKIYKNYLNFIIYINLTINNFFSHYLLIIFFISGFFTLTAEIGIIVSLAILLSNIFSGNHRSIIIADKNKLLADEMLLKRIILAIPLIIILIFFISKNNLSDIYLALSISFVVILGWISELILTKLEIEKNIKAEKIHLYFTVSLSLLVFFSGMINNLIYLKILIYLYNIFLIIFIIFFLKLEIKKFKFINYSENFFKGLLKVNYISSISISLSNFLFRYFLILFISKEKAGILFACFMIGSFPGSIFNQIFGANLIRKNISLKKIIYPILILSLPCILYLFTKIPFENLLSNIGILSKDKNTFIYITLFFSVIGLNFMIAALYIRQKNIFSNSSRENYFIIDMFLSLSVILIIPTIYLIFGTNEIFYSVGFLVSSILAIIFYKSPNLNIDNDKFLKLCLIFLLVPFFFVYYDKNLNFYVLGSEILNLHKIDNAKNRLLNFLIFLPLILYFGLKKIENKTVATSFVLTAILSIISINLLRNYITIESHFNLLQTLIPMFFLILGELLLNDKHKKYLFYRYSFFIFFIYIIVKNLLFFLDLEIVVAYFNLVPTSIFISQEIFILFFSFYCLIKIKNKKTNKYLINFYTLNLLIFCILGPKSYSLAIIFFYLYTHILLNNRKSFWIFLPVFIFLIFLNYSEIISIVSNHLQIFFFLARNVLIAPRELLFGFNYFNEEYQFPLPISFYQDFIYNFGLVSLIPLLYLIYYTVKKIKNRISSTSNIEMMFFIFFVIGYPLLAVSLNDIYIGSIIYLYWSTLINTKKTFSQISNV
jgi:hypothetical protein